MRNEEWWRCRIKLKSGGRFLKVGSMQFVGESILP